MSYWVDYGVALGEGTSRQWQIPIGLQLVPAALLGLGMLTLKESTRWLTRKGRHDEALASLRWIRGDDSGDGAGGGASQAVLDEMAAIRHGVALEMRATEGFRAHELLQRDYAQRMGAAFALFLAQQATGATAFAYFGPQYFKLLVGPGTRNLLLTAIFGAVKVVACGVFVLFVSERVGRRKVLIGGAVLMSACQITTAVVDKVTPPPSSGAITGSGIAMVALIYLFVVAYNFSWGPMPWPYVSEYVSIRIAVSFSLPLPLSLFLCPCVCPPLTPIVQNLPRAHSRARHGGGRGLAVALQFCLFAHDAVHDPQPGLGHFFALGPV